MQKFILSTVVTLIIAGMVGIFVAGNGSNSPKPTTVALLGDKHANQGQKHIAIGAQHEKYNSNPPSSGSHYINAAPWGIKPVELPDETLIHNLEHGGIEIAYKPDLPQAQVDQLKKIVTALPPSSKFNETKIVLAPRAANDKPIELVAWTYTYGLDAPDEAKITQFYNGHLDKGPELVP
jgi:hypothetical protein